MEKNACERGCDSGSGCNTGVITSDVMCGACCVICDMTVVVDMLCGMDDTLPVMYPTRVLDVTSVVCCVMTCRRC
jgi:hypothetical protein